MAQRGDRGRALWTVLALSWMVAIAIAYFLPGARGLVDPRLQTPSSPAAVGVAALARGAAHIAAAGLIFFSAWGYGRALLAVPRLVALLEGRLRGRLDRSLTALGLGLGLLSGVALVLAGVQLLRPPAVVTVALVGVAVAAWSLRQDIRGRRTQQAPQQLRVPLTWIEWALLVFVALGGALALVGALAPEVEYDALWYHLEFPQRHLAAGTIVDDVCQYVSPYPWGGELLFGYGLALNGTIAAKLVHFGFGVLTVLAAYELATHIGGRRAGIFTAAVLVATPTFLWEATTAYVELATAFFVLLALSWVLRYVEQRSLAVLVLAGVFLGFALSTKHLAGVAALPLAAIVFFASGGRGTRQRVVAVALLAAVAALPALPWYIRAQVQAGNPVFPILYEVFGADPRRWTEASAAGLQRFEDRFGHGSGPLALLKLPWSTTMHGASFGGSLGVAYLMFVPLVLLPLAFAHAPWRRRLPREVLMTAAFCLGYVLLWASPLSSLQLRFLVPVLAPLAVLAGYGFDRVMTAAAAWRPSAAAAVAMVALVVLGLSLPPFLRMHERDRVGFDGWLTHVLREVPVNVVVGAESRGAYLTRRIPAYRAVTRLNELAAPDDTAVMATDPFVDLYAQPRLVPDFAVCLNQAGLGRGGAADYAALRRAGVDFLLVEVRLREDSVVKWYDADFAGRYLDLAYADDKARVYRVHATVPE